MSDKFYFGCFENKGHYFFNEKMNKYFELDSGFPFNTGEIDTFFLKDILFKEHGKSILEKQGESIITHKHGWTVLSFWDRSVDSRYGSNSNFFIKGIFTFDEMLEQCKSTFPKIFSRFKFDVVEYKL